MATERWMRPALLTSGVAVTGCGLAFGFLDRDGTTVVGVLFIGFLALVIALFEPRLLELTAILGDKLQLVLKLRNAQDALATAQAVAEDVRTKAAKLDDPQDLRDAITSASEAIDSIAEDFLISGPEVALRASDLKFAPFAGVVTKLPDGFALDLLANGKGDGTEPIDVMCIVTDPRQVTLTKEKRVDSPTSRLLVSFRWPDDYTSGSDIPAGRHKVDWFVAPVAVGPRRRFQHVASASFGWRLSPSSPSA